MKIQSISHTVHPDGSRIKYLFGMPKPEPENLGHVMKKAVRWHLNKPRKGGVQYQDEADRAIRKLMAR